MITRSVSDKAKAEFKAAIQGYMQAMDLSPSEAEKKVWPLIRENFMVHALMNGKSLHKNTKETTCRLIDEIFDELNGNPV